MTPSSPSTQLSSFDPAIYLHSEAQAPPSAFDENPPISDSYSDDLEALHSYRLEQSRNKVVIRHRAWNLSDVFRSDEDIRPYTPTKSPKNIIIRGRQHSSPSRKSVDPSGFRSSPPIPIAEMPFLSDSPPALSPQRAQTPTEQQQQKRKNEDASQPAEPKRQKVIGGFVEDEDEGDEADEVAAAALGEEHVEPKQQKVIGGFVDEEEGEDESDEVAAAAFGDEHLGDSQVGIGELPTGPLGDLGAPQTSLQSSWLADSQSDPSALADRSRLPGRPTSNVNIKTCARTVHNIPMRSPRAPIPYERLVASRSTAAPGRAKKSYYGIEIHRLLDEAARDAEQSATIRQAETRPALRPSVEAPVTDKKTRKLTSTMWTEKYRARKFTDLIGDERTHRSVLRWLKGWDPIVFPNLAKSKSKKSGQDDGEQFHRKIMLLSGPPGLGKTTLAHVCARQAGYEVLEINASDERSKDVVKGRVRDALGTENVKGVNVEVGHSKVRKPGRPVCVVIDEVDGVVSGSSGGGEGGFMKALIDLVLLDQKNASRTSEQQGKGGKKKKGDKFRFLRPLILVCNDVYHPSLRPLRASSIAEMVHVRQPPLENVVGRVKHIFNREGVACDSDAVRKLCEASWGLAGRKQGSKSSGAGQGDIRSALVAAEWVAHKFKTSSTSPTKLNKNWLEQNVLSGSTEGGSFFKGLNRGGVREVVDRVFTTGAGFPDAPAGQNYENESPYDDDAGALTGIADSKKRHVINSLREMVDSSGDHDRCISECFGVYPMQEYQDDTFLSKPNAACDWLQFHDLISSRVFYSQDWELSPYLSHSVLAFHNLFASTNGKNRNAAPNDDSDDEEEEHPFLGPRADYAAFEAQKQNRAILTGFHSSLSAPMIRLFRSSECVVTDLIPNLLRMLSPDVKPVVVRGSGEQRSVASVRKESERALVRLAVRVMAEMGVTFEKVRVEADGGGYGGWAYRMEPPLDTLVSFSKVKGTSMASSSSSAPVRYAVRQVLDQEYQKESRQRQVSNLNPSASPAPNKTGKKSVKQSGRENRNEEDANAAADKYVKRDFFGRVIEDTTQASNEGQAGSKAVSKGDRNVYISFHEGYSNAVRKPISMSEFLAGL